MAKNVELEQLVINKLTQEQYNKITSKNPNELYFITDAEIDTGITKEEADQTYLPLSGGTITGALHSDFGEVDSNFDRIPWLSFHYKSPSYDNTRVIKIWPIGGNLDFSDFGAIYNASDMCPEGNYIYSLGRTKENWKTVYTQALCNTDKYNAEADAARIIVPKNLGGTLARLEDIPEGTQLETLPTASADNLNKIYQYVGETTTDYINGYFYKSTNDIVQDWFTTGYAQYDTSLTLIVTVDKEKFLAQNPVWSDMGAKTWRADYDESTGEWYVWTQQPQIYISNADLKDVWGIDITNAAGDYVPANGDTLMVQLTESESFSWERVDVQPTSNIEDSMGSANAVVDTHDTSLDVHENIRGIANGLATLDNNAKVPMSQINDSLLGNVQYQGLYDVSTNTPNLDTVETKGHYYIVSVAGDRFDISFEVGDWIISDGTNWTKVDNTDAVSSVNGRTGNVVITTEDLDLSSYVQKTDYASSKAAGLIRGYNANGFGFVPDTGYPFCEAKSLASYNVAGGNLFIGKGTLESIKYSYVRDGIANNTYPLADTEKEKVRNWIGAGVPTAFETMPDIYASAGKTYQYVGETTEEFTSGYFYKSVSQGISYIPSDSNLTFDFDLFWSELATAGITVETLQMTEMDKERGGFSIIGTVESETNYRVQDINGVQLDVLLTQAIRSTSEYVGANNRWYYKPSETFAWERVDVQPVPEVDALPDQTDNAGKFLMTDGTEASWGGDSLLKNNTDLPTSLAIGLNASVNNNNATAVGNQAQGGNTLSVALGDNAKARGLCSTALGAKAVASSSYAIQLGTGTNSDANTFKVANANGNFEMMSADGTIPTDRYTTTPTDAGTYVPKLTIAEDGTATREWSTESNNTMAVPTPPTDNGTYVLKATVVDGVVTTEWVLEA